MALPPLLRNELQISPLSPRICAARIKCPLSRRCSLINPSLMKLSFCIPTYNRADYIGSTLTNILAQCRDDVEIIIIDGASTDNTAEVVENLRCKFNNIHYYSESRNNGVDADLAKAVAMAHGEYCWLMSSDDCLAPGAVARILAEIEQQEGVYLCNITACTKDLKPV